MNDNGWGSEMLAARDMERDVRAIDPSVIAALTAHGPDAISFDYLGVNPSSRGQGFADAAISVVCRRADAQKMTVWMQPNSGFGSDLRRMVPWYVSHGFVPVTGLSPLTMRRHPVVPRMLSTRPTSDLEIHT